MKRPFLLLFALCIASLTFGQEAEKAKANKTHEFGINATLLTDVLLDNGGVDLTVTPYLFTYKAIGENGKTFRLGFGGKMDYTEEVEEKRKEHDNGIDLRIGYERQWTLAPKWSTSIGIDFLGSYENFGAKTDFAKTANKTWTVGTGSVLGIQWMIGPKVGLSTETSFNYIHSQTKEKVEFEDQTFNDDDEVTAKSNSFNFVLPTSLYLFVRF